MNIYNIDEPAQLNTPDMKVGFSQTWCKWQNWKTLKTHMYKVLSIYVTEKHECKLQQRDTFFRPNLFFPMLSHAPTELVHVLLQKIIWQCLLHYIWWGCNNQVQSAQKGVTKMQIVPFIWLLHTICLDNTPETQCPILQVALLPFIGVSQNHQ